MGSGVARSAVVVGGGVGGLATGLALQRAGWDVQVRERAPVIEAAGTGLVLWPNALRCLRSLGLLGEVRDRSTELRESRLLLPDGRTLSRAGVATPDEGGALGVLRPDLVELLAAALAPGTLRLGAPVADPCDLDADLVVGADGLRSVVRTTLWPSAQPVARGSTVWRAVLPRREGPPGRTPGLAETWGRGVRFGVVPVGVGSTYVYAVAPAGDRPTEQPGPLPEWFERWHAPVPAVLESLAPDRWLRHDVHDLRPGGTPLHRGRYALVGDAGHAMEPNLGQGACLALEDAVVLAHCVTAGASVETALEAYDAARRRRVAGLSRRSRQVGLMASRTRPALTRVRDAGMRLTPDWCTRLALRQAVDWRPPAVADLSRPGSR